MVKKLKVISLEEARKRLRKSTPSAQDIEDLGVLIRSLAADEENIYYQPLRDHNPDRVSWLVVQRCLRNAKIEHGPIREEMGIFCNTRNTESGQCVRLSLLLKANPGESVPSEIWVLHVEMIIEE